MSKLLQTRVRLQDGLPAAVVPDGPGNIPADADIVVTGARKVGWERVIAVETTSPNGEKPAVRIWVPIRRLGECSEGDRVLVELEGGWVDGVVLPDVDAGGPGARR
jgi:hypothetical protein